MYNNRVNLNLQVTDSFFRYLFVMIYNVDFCTPKTDLCSTCLQFQEKIKTVTDPGIINTLTVQQRLHKIRAKVVYEFLEENQENLEVVMFRLSKKLGTS